MPSAGGGGASPVTASSFKIKDPTTGKLLTLTVTANTILLDRNVIFPYPDASGDSVAYLATAQTLTNKTIAAGSNTISGIANANIAAAAAIAFSKLAALTSAHILVGNGSNVAADVAVTGDISITNAGVTAIAAGVIVDADVNASAAIASSKLDLSGMRAASSLSSVIAVLTSKGAMVPSSSAPTQSDVTGTNLGYTVLDYPDASTTNAYWHFTMPPGVGTNKNIIIKIFWISTATSGAVTWGASVLGRTSGEAFDTAMSANTETTTTTAGSAGQVNITTITINTAGIDADDAVIVRISRNGGGGSDTMTTNARFLEAQLTWS